MGVCAFLVSDEKKEFCDLGKILLSEKIVALMKKKLDATLLSDWLLESDGDLNIIPSDTDTRGIAGVAVAWMENHSDWRFLTDADEEYDDVYLADDDENAKEYAEEFGAEIMIYKKTGSIFNEGGI